MQLGKTNKEQVRLESTGCGKYLYALKFYIFKLYVIEIEIPL